MTQRPAAAEAAPYYFRYIDLVPDGDVVACLSAQLDELRRVFGAIPERVSAERPDAEVWSLRELVGHLADTERLFLGRAWWFARGFDAPLPSFDQHVAVAHAASDALGWHALIDDLLVARRATVSFLRLLPADAWDRRGDASGEAITVRALAFLAAGHVAHHLRLLPERYSRVMDPANDDTR